MLDTGYDQMEKYEATRNVKAQAIIPLNPRNEKEPPARITSKGTPCCSMGFSMTYWGQEKIHLKFRCPHATGQVNCPLHDRLNFKFHQNSDRLSFYRSAFTRLRFRCGLSRTSNQNMNYAKCSNKKMKLK